MEIIQLLFDIQNKADVIYRSVDHAHADYNNTQEIEFDIDIQIKSAKELVQQLELLKLLMK